MLGFTVSEVSGRFRNHAASVVDADFERLLVLLGGYIDDGSGVQAADHTETRD